MESERGLDEPGRARGGHRVTDHRLHRAERRPRSAGLAEELRQRGKLDLVTGDRRRTVRFDQPDGGGIAFGGAPCRAEGRDLAVRTRSHRARFAAVARYPGAEDHRIDPIAGALRIGEPLEHHDPRALAEHDAVRATIERADRRALAERSELREHAPERDVVADVHAAGEDHVTPAVRELAAAVVDREQRARTGRIDRVRRAAQIEPVRDPGRREVRNQADRGFGADLARPRTKRRADRVDGCRVEIGEQLVERGHELLRHPHSIRETRHAGREIRAAPEDHPCPLARDRSTGVGERCRGDVQREQLIRLGGRGGDRHDAEFDGIEARRDEAAALAGEGVAKRRIEALCGNVGDRVDAGLDVRPVRVEIRCPGKHRGHPDDRDRFRHGLRGRA